MLNDVLKLARRRTVTVTGPALPQFDTGAPVFILSALKGSEALSTVSRYDITLTTSLDVPEAQAASIDIASLIGTELTVTIELDGMGSLAGAMNIGAGTREISGIVTEARFVDRLNRQCRYALVLQPWLWLLGQTTDYRIFQRKSVIEIVEEVFDPYLYSFEFRTGGTYEPIDYVVQYGETSLDFIQRKLAEAGIYWFVEHSGTFHRIVFVDHLGGHGPVDSLAYQTLEYHAPDRKIDLEYIDRFEAAQRLTTGVYTTSDYHFKKPSADLTAQDRLPQDIAHNDLERRGWPGNYTEHAAGGEIAQVHMEALRAPGERASGHGNLRSVVCGTTFTLANHPRPEANREYLVLWAALSIEETGETAGSGAQYGIEVDFEVQPATVVYRTDPSLWPKPRVSGPQTAIVTGPEGSEIWTDSYGRAKLHFHWDHAGPRDQNSSCWIRVSYPWAGSNFGGIHVPRVGTEVIVDFENGDPERPIITGRLYNASTMPPWQLPGNATQSGILTRSSKGGGYGNANAIRFEDRKGQEQVWIQAERNLDTVVENDETHTVGHNRAKSVGHDETDRIGRNWKLHTGGWKFETIDLAAVQNVGFGQMLNVGAAYNVNVGGLYLRNVALQMSSTVGHDRSDRVAQSWTADVGHTYSLTVRGKAVGDAVQKDMANPVEATPDFAPNLPDAVSSAENNQILIKDTGEAHLSGAKQAQLIGPGGKVTIDDAGITLEGKGIYLKAPVISMSGGNAGGLAPVTEADAAPTCPSSSTGAQKTTTCSPVDLATGQKVLVHGDFNLPGRIAIAWGRSYRSADQRVGALGVAWRLPYSTEIRRDDTQLTYFDGDGRRLNFPPLEPGGEHFHVIEKITLVRGQDIGAWAVYAMRFGNGVTEHYAIHPTDPARWQLQRVSNRDGNVLSLGYTPQGWLNEVRNNVHTVRCELDDAGRITAVYLDDHGKPLLARYAYDANGDLVEATDRAGRMWRYQYRHHLLAAYRTPSGAVHMSEWDGDTPQARVTRTFAYVDDEAARSGKPAITRDTRFAYQPASKTTRVTDGLSRTTEYHYNGLWAVDRVLYPDGSSRLIHFDETGSVSGTTDELGRVTQMVNDTRGNPVTVIDPAGNITRLSYNNLNLPVQITDPAGQVWQRAYDDAGHLTAETDPLGNTTAYTYEKGLPATRTDALGNVTAMQWNDAGQLVARTDCSGHTTQFAYDGEGRLITTTDPLGNESWQSWDVGRGRLNSVTPAGLGAWSVGYDVEGRVVTHTDPLQRVTRTQWDAYNQRLNVTDPAGGMNGYGYDLLGRLTTLTNANGEQTTFEYDSRDRLVAQTGFDGRRQTYRYSAAGEVIARTDHGTDGQITTDMAYDVLGRPVERHSSDGTHASYRYDARGLLTQAQATAPGEEASQVTFEYDAAGRRTGETQAHHGKVWRLAHELDVLGHRSATHLPDAGTLTWQRYGSGHVHGVLLNGETLAAFERDALHRETLRTQGTVAHTFSYSPAGLLAGHRWQGLDSRGHAAEAEKVWRSWEHDRSGQITALHDAMRDSRAYQYDPASRLTAVSAGGASETFAYDPAGNLLAVSQDKVTHVGNVRGDRLLSLATPEHPVDQVPQYSYDGHGNRIAITVLGASEAAATRYRYDGTHQLKGVELANGSRGSYEYDALGRRTAKHVTDANGRVATTLFVWDGDWMAQEVRAGDVKPVTYIPHPNHAGPLTKLDGAKAYHYATDHLGTPQELYDGQRQIVWAADLSAYGKTRRYLKHEIDNPIRFPGQYLDAESALHYNRFRYYDPQAARYINQDPIGLAGGSNTYVYANNLPIARIDPWGLDPSGAMFGDGVQQRASLGMSMLQAGASPSEITQAMTPQAPSLLTIWRDFHGSASVDAGLSGHVLAGGGGAVGVAASKAPGDLSPDACVYLSFSQTAGPGAAGGAAITGTLSSAATTTGASNSFGAFATGGILGDFGGAIQSDNINPLKAGSGSVSGSVGIGAGAAGGAMASQQYSMCIKSSVESGIRRMMNMLQKR